MVRSRSKPSAKTRIRSRFPKAGSARDDQGVEPRCRSELCVGLENQSRLGDDALLPESEDPELVRRSPGTRSVVGSCEGLQGTRQIERSYAVEDDETDPARSSPSHRAFGGMSRRTREKRWCSSRSTGRCRTRSLAGRAPKNSPALHSRFGRTGRGAKPPPQLGHTSCSTESAHAAQNVHSKLQMRASVACGGRGRLQCSQPGRSSSMHSSYAPTPSGTRTINRCFRTFGWGVAVLVLRAPARYIGLDVRAHPQTGLRSRP